ncbi:MAG: hemolysin III family protein [Oligoflexia bacterium]|nr:hemolysin III family protein [Oligoflexia bacterium]
MMHSKKPLLRGYLHQEAFFVALGACVLLIAKSSNQTSLLASLIYSLCLLLLFGISTVYHRPHWNPKGRALMKRFDHSAIFLLIAGTFTPICLLALSEKDGSQLLIVIWSAALLGIIQSIFWIKAPKWFTALFYVIMGWIAIPYFHEMQLTLGINNMLLVASGGVVYTVGAVFYAMKKPNFVPGVFGYHELFHLFTIIGVILHFIVVYRLIN